MLTILIATLLFLLNLDYALLRTLRNTLAVADLGGGAQAIPLFELCGSLPAAIIATWLFHRLLYRFSLPQLFLPTMAFFLLFFLAFTALYPWLATLRHPQIAAALFYALAELWKPVLVTILLWGWLNRTIGVQRAQSLYGLLLCSSSLGAIAAQPIITASTLGKEWSASLMQITYVVTGTGIVAALLFLILQNLSLSGSVAPPKLPRISLSAHVLRSAPLRLLCCIVIADYIAYALGEVLFLETLHRYHPNPEAYCRYLGDLSFWTGASTLVCCLAVTPLLLRRWLWAALATPLCLLVTEGLFFLLLRTPHLSQTWMGWSEMEWLAAVVSVGSTQYVLCRAAKYALFDAAKEVAFVQLPASDQIRGKLAVDGLAARMGRGGASLLTLGLINSAGGVLASAPWAGFIALIMGMSWLVNTLRLQRNLSTTPCQSSLSSTL